MHSQIKRLVYDALLTACALTIFVIELQFPNIVPIPGVKLGLANIVTLTSLYIMGPADAACILLARVLLGCLVSGQVSALMYSLTGGILCLIVTLLLKRLVTIDQIFVLGVIGALAHNIGQISVAALVTGTGAIFYYLPTLAVSGIIAGLFTGFAAQFAVKHLKRILKKGA